MKTIISDAIGFAAIVGAVLALWAVTPANAGQCRFVRYANSSYTYYVCN